MTNEITQCVLIVSGQEVIVEKSDKPAFIEQAMKDGRVVFDPEAATLDVIM